MISSACAAAKTLTWEQEAPVFLSLMSLAETRLRNLVNKAELWMLQSHVVADRQKQIGFVWKKIQCDRILECFLLFLHEV